MVELQNYCKYLHKIRDPQYTVIWFNGQLLLETLNSLSPLYTSRSGIAKVTVHIYNKTNFFKRDTKKLKHLSTRKDLFECGIHLKTVLKNSQHQSDFDSEEVRTGIL